MPPIRQLPAVEYDAVERQRRAPVSSTLPAWLESNAVQPRHPRFQPADGAVQRTAVDYDSADRQRILPVSVSLASYHVVPGHPNNYGLLPVGSRSHSQHTQTNTCMHDAHFHSFHTTGVVVARRAAETAEPGRSRGFKEQVLCRPLMTCAMVQHHGACLYRMTGLATAVVVDPFALSARSLC
jgi:hypothetical protein